LQSKLGDSLGAIGERESLNNRDGAREHLEEAILADRAALRVMTMKYLSPDRSPTEWKQANKNLNEVLNLLHQRGAAG